MKTAKILKCFSPLWWTSALSSQGTPLNACDWAEVGFVPEFVALPCFHLCDRYLGLIYSLWPCSLKKNNETSWILLSPAASKQAAKERHRKGSAFLAEKPERFWPAAIRDRVGRSES